MSEISEKQILDALKRVVVIKTGKDIVELGAVRDIEIDGGTVRLRLVLPDMKKELVEKYRADCREIVLDIDGIEKVEIRMGEGSGPSAAPTGPFNDIKHIILVASGKGGVGKSTVAVNLAAALKLKGNTVGIMDADIYGPSIPPMLGISGPPGVENEKMVPPVAHGMPVMSIGFLTRDEDAIIWRGPILHKVLTQFINDVNWGPLDYLVIDLPPGTGDVQISLAQLVHASGALLVTTPQEIAFRDVRRAGMMFSKVDVPIIGFVENMAYFVCPKCSEKTEIFPPKDKGSTRAITPDLMAERLARIPIEPDIAVSSEMGTPIVIAKPDSETAKQFMELADKVVEKLWSPAFIQQSGGPTDQD